MENKYIIKFDEIMEEFHEASNFMSCLQTQNEDVINQIKKHDKQMSSVIETLHSVQEQSKEHEKKSETFMKQQKSSENSFSFRLDEVMKEQKYTENSFILRLDEVMKQQKSTENSFSLRLDEVMKEQKYTENSFGLRLDEVMKEQKSTENCFGLRLAEVMKQQKSTENSFSLRFDKVIKQQKSTENSFSLKLDKAMKDILSNAESINKLSNVNELAKKFDTIIPNFQKRLKDLEENFKAMDSTCKEIEDSNKIKFDETTLKSTELFDKILNVSSQVDTMFKELKLSRQQACFFAQAFGAMNVQMDLKKDQIVTSFGHVLNNIGNHYARTKGIFTAPCDGLYLCSLTLRFDIGENVHFGIKVKGSSGEECKCILQTTTVKTSSSVTTLLSLKKNDQLYIASVEDYRQVKIHTYSSFMCALINKD